MTKYHRILNDLVAHVNSNNLYVDGALDLSKCTYKNYYNLFNIPGLLRTSHTTTTHKAQRREETKIMYFILFIGDLTKMTFLDKKKE